MSTLEPTASLSITSTHNYEQPTSTWTSATETTDALANMMSAFDATMAATDPLYTRPAIALSDSPAATANALSILFAALPSAAALAIASQYNLQPATVDPQPTSADSQPTTPQILLVPSSPSGQNFSQAISTPTPSSTMSSQLSTNLPSPTVSLVPAFTTTIAESEHIQNRAIAGIVSGVTAGTVLIIIAIVWLLRRRQQGKRPFEHRKVYPEVAWLYDPAPTPTGSMHSRHNSAEEVLLRPRQEEMEQARLASPERPSYVNSPLLPPSRTLLNGEGVLRVPWQGGTTIRTVRRSSAASERRPMHAIFEESQPQ